MRPPGGDGSLAVRCAVRAAQSGATLPNGVPLVIRRLAGIRIRSARWTLAETSQRNVPHREVGRLKACDTED